MFLFTLLVITKNDFFREAEAELSSKCYFIGSLQGGLNSNFNVLVNKLFFLQYYGYTLNISKK